MDKEEVNADAMVILEDALAAFKRMVTDGGSRELYVLVQEIDERVHHLREQAKEPTQATEPALEANVPQPSWKTVTDEEAVNLLAEGVHAGLRHGTDADDAFQIWNLIRGSNTGGWKSAITYAIDGLGTMGIVMVQKQDSETYIKVSDDELAGIIGERLHAALRKNIAGDSATALWAAIADNRYVYTKAVEEVVAALDFLGYQVTRKLDK